MYTLDISGHDATGKPGINRYGGLYLSVQDASREAHREQATSRLHFTPELLWIRNEEGETVLREAFSSPTYTVTIISTAGDKHTYKCSGSSDQEALIYAGKVVEEKADKDDPTASIVVTKRGEPIGPLTTVADMLGQKISKAP